MASLAPSRTSRRRASAMSSRPTPERQWSGRAFYHADGWAPDGARRTERIWGVSAEEARYRRALP